MVLAAIGMPGAMWRHMRKLEDVTDDELVEAVAQYGMLGTGEFGWQRKHQFAQRLDFSDGDDELSDELEDALTERLEECSALWCSEGDRYLVWHLTTEEWGRRLFGKSELEIAELLKGTA